MNQKIIDRQRLIIT